MTEKKKIIFTDNLLLSGFARYLRVVSPSFEENSTGFPIPPANRSTRLFCYKQRDVI